MMLNCCRMLSEVQIASDRVNGKQSVFLLKKESWKFSILKQNLRFSGMSRSSTKTSLLQQWRSKINLITNCQAQPQLQLKLGWDGYIQNYPNHPATQPPRPANNSYLSGSGSQCFQTFCPKMSKIDQKLVQKCLKSSKVGLKFKKNLKSANNFSQLR